MNKTYFLLFVLVFAIFRCTTIQKNRIDDSLSASLNVLDYRGVPDSISDRSMLMFSDQGAWFAYSLTDPEQINAGFSGPFLMTEQNGFWASPSLSKLELKADNNQVLIDWKNYLKSQKSFSSHLEQEFKNDKIIVQQQLAFYSDKKALIKFTIKNIGEDAISIHPSISGELFKGNSFFTRSEKGIDLYSKTSNAMGTLHFYDTQPSIMVDSFYYNAHFNTTLLPKDSNLVLYMGHSLYFQNQPKETTEESDTLFQFQKVLSERQLEKEVQLKRLLERNNPKFRDSIYQVLIAKAHLTLQNNWRKPAGTLHYEGLFPSYHYEWFHGFWAWDSWKHAVGLSYFNVELAKNQVLAMFDFQEKNGFIPDCVFRDTTIEKHNYRDTKPPLSTWAVSKIFEVDKDTSFVKLMYPKLKAYHDWWYQNRDYDKDGLCEYGSTDGSLLAAKWESGMDNAIRFDTAKMLQSGPKSYSLAQESVDLNAYLYAEKRYLAGLAKIINNTGDTNKFTKESILLKQKIQSQFFDQEDGWFYDTNLDGNHFIKAMGCEAWIPLWANAASKEQADAVMLNMMDTDKFFTKVPFQTLSADHSNFSPSNGYWRGPNWLDQAYFGVQGLKNYGYHEAADKASFQILKGADGLLKKGPSIRENYHPISGEGLNAKNFSWSAAHILMLLLNE